MIISDEKKFLFVHVPKTAGSSVSKALEPYASKNAVSALHTHETISEFYQRVRRSGQSRFTKYLPRRTHDASARYANYFSFGFVRNPWARAVSSYSFLKRIGLPEIEGRNFDGFMDDLAGGAHYLRAIFIARAQIDYFTDYRGEVIVDMIGRQERMAQDFAAICEKISVDPQLEHYNASAHKPYVDYFSDAQRDMIARIYARDIEAFGYSFDDALSTSDG